jgi:hypothetical protein
MRMGFGPAGALGIVTIACGFACGGTGTNSGFNTGGGDSGSLTGGDDGGGGNLGDDGGGGNANGCTGQAADYVYVLSVENDLYSFKPDQKVFTKIGALGCQTTMQPNSMAIDRNANAWVNYVATSGLGTDTAGALYKVSTKDASCLGSQINLPTNWFRVGMGYSTDSATSKSETLYIAATGNGAQMGSAPGLGKINFQANAMQIIGPFGGALNGQSAELTGTGDGRLYGFFVTTPVQVAQIDKASGATSMATPLPQVETPAFWAFSFWGGKFYLYTCPDMTLNPQRTSNVTEYDPTTGSVNPTYMTNVGFRIVGAGVSTCAPVAPPK